MTPVVFGIAGGTASGKSTVARALVEQLGEACLWLTHDRYYRSIPKELAHNPAAFNFDHPDSLETSRMVCDLAALRSGETVRVPEYDFATHLRRPERDWDTLEPRPIIVVEGILVLSDAHLRAQMDHKVFVHAPDDVRLARRVLRDIRERGRHVDDVITQYLTTVRPMHETFVAPSQAQADLVLDGTIEVDDLVARLLGLLS